MSQQNQRVRKPELGWERCPHTCDTSKDPDGCPFVGPREGSSVANHAKKPSVHAKCTRMCVANGYLHGIKPLEPPRAAKWELIQSKHPAVLRRYLERAEKEHRSDAPFLKEIRQYLESEGEFDALPLNISLNVPMGLFTI